MCYCCTCRPYLLYYLYSNFSFKASIKNQSLSVSHNPHAQITNFFSRYNINLCLWIENRTVEVLLMNKESDHSGDSEYTSCVQWAVTSASENITDREKPVCQVSRRTVYICTSFITTVNSFLSYIKTRIYMQLLSQWNLSVHWPAREESTTKTEIWW